VEQGFVGMDDFDEAGSELLVEELI
jgi:diketogulonate reductase-like aldo/keto reductase